MKIFNFIWFPFGHRKYKIIRLKNGLGGTGGSGIRYGPMGLQALVLSSGSMSFDVVLDFERKTKPSRSLTGIRVLKLLLTFLVESVFRIKSLVLVLITSGSLKIVQITASTHSGVVKLPSYLNF